MADRTVDLVIRARNEATAVLQQITASLDDFTKSQSGVASGADKTSSALDKLVHGLGDITKGLSNLKEFGRVQAEMQRLGEAADKLGQEAGAASVQANRLAAGLAQIERAQTAALARTNAATTAVKAQTAAVEADARALRSLDGQIVQTRAAMDTLDRRSAGGSRLTDSQQDRRAELERRLRTLQSLRETQDVRAGTSNAALSPLQAEQRDAGAQATAIGAQLATLRKEFNAAETSAATLAGRLSAVVHESQELQAAAAGVSERLGIDASKAGSYTAALDKVLLAQERVNAAIQRNKAIGAGLAPNAGLFTAAQRSGTAGDQAAIFRDQRAAVDQAERARDVAQTRATAAGRQNAVDPTEANGLAMAASRVDLDTTERALQREVATLDAIRASYAKVKAAAIEAASDAAAAEQSAAEKRASAAQKLAAAEASAAQKLAAAEAEAARKRGVDSARVSLREARANVSDNPAPADASASATTGNYRSAIGALGELKQAEDDARAAVERAAAAAVREGLTKEGVSTAIEGEKAALAAATAAYAAQAAEVDRVRVALAQARAATQAQAAAEQALNAALQQGVGIEEAFVRAQAAALNAEAAGNAAGTRLAQLREYNALQRTAAEAARALAAAEAEEGHETLSVAEATSRSIAAKRALAAATRELEAIERAEERARAGQLESLAALEARAASVLVAYVGLQQAYGSIRDAFEASTNYEAAQVRVTQALGQSNEAGAAAFQHVVDKATALKVPVLEATDSFGKFLAAVKGTSIEGAQATRIFDSFLTISRGFKLDPESIQRGTIALRDLAASGQVSLRYLNQFDRAVPVGLLSAMAKAAGYAEGNISGFLKAVHAGQIGLDVLAPALDNVANSVNKNLDSALKTSQSTLVDFQNAFLQAQLAFTSGGFLDSVIAALNHVNEVLRSDEGRAGLRDTGAIIGQVIGLLGILATHAKTVLEVLAAIGAVKLVSVLAGADGIVGLFSNALAPLEALRAAKAANVAEDVALASAEAELAAAELAIVPATEAATAATLGFGEALLALLASPVGIALAIGGAAAAAVAFAGGSSQASHAGDDFNRVLDDLKTKSDGAASGIAGAREELEKLSQIDIDKAILSQRDAIAETAAELRRFSDAQRLSKISNTLFGDNNNDDLNKIQDFAQSLQSGGIAVDDFKDKYEELYNSLTNKTAIAHLLVEKEAMEKYVDQTRKLAALAQASDGRSKLGGVEDDARKAGDQLTALTVKLGGSNDAMRASQEAASAYAQALEKLAKVYPELAEEEKKRNEQSAVADLRSKAAAADMAADRAAGGGGGVGGIMQTDNRTFADARIAEGQQAEIQKKFSELPGFSQSEERVANRVFGFESGGDAKAQSPTGAVGTGQFLASTFVEQFKKAFGDVGLKDNQIAALRTNDEISKYLGKQYLREQGAALAPYGDPSVSTGAKSYLGYNVGTTNARRLLEADPNALARNTLDPAVYNPNKALYGDKTNKEVLDRIEKIVGGGQKLNEKGQTTTEQRDLEVTKIFDKTIRDLTGKTTAAGEDKKAVAVNAAGQRFTDETLAANTKANNGQEVKELTKEQQKQLDIVKEKAAAEYEASHKDEAEKAALEELTTLEERRKVAIDEMNDAQKRGDTSKVDEYRKKVEELTTKLKAALPEAKKLVDALGDQKGVLKLEQTQKALDETKDKTNETGKSIANSFAGQGVSAMDGFFSDLEKGKNAVTALQNAFLKFASSFLKEIAEMILKKTLLAAIGGGTDGGTGGIFSGLGSAIGSIGTGGAGAGVGSLLGGLFHEGGTVGAAPLMTRSVDPTWFANAPRFHDGGFPGLSPSEVPIIAQKGEQVLSKAQVAANGRGTAGNAQPRPVKNVLVMGDSEIAAALAGSHGQDVVMSHIKRNASTISKMVK